MKSVLQIEKTIKRFFWNEGGNSGINFTSENKLTKN